jgi:hypothetical protein
LERVWTILLISLLADPLISLCQPAQITPDRALSWAIVAGLVLLPFLAQEALYRAIAALRILNTKQLETKPFIIPLLSAVFIGGIIVLKILSLVQIGGVWGLAVLVLITAATLHGVAGALRTNAQHARAIKSDAWSRLLLWESQLVVLSLIPLLIARSISLLGAFSTSLDVSPTRFLLFFSVSVLFLAMLRPTKRLFVSFCKKCKQPVPIVFVDLGSCIQCDEKLQAAYLRSTSQK